MNTKLNTWVHPKSGETRIYLNGFDGVKIYAVRLNEDSYQIRGWYDYPEAVPSQYHNSGKTWAISIFMDQLEELDAPRHVVDSWAELVKFCQPHTCA